MADEERNEEGAPEEQAGAADDGGGEDLKKSKKRRLILIVIIGLILILGGGAGAFFFLSGGDAGGKKDEDSVEAVSGEEASEGESKEGETGDSKEGDEKADSEGEQQGDDGSLAANAGKLFKNAASKKEDEIDFGDTLELKTFHMNLGNPLENRYVRLEISIEYNAGDENQKNEILKRKPQIRDAIVSIVSRKTMEFLLAPDGKTQLRKEILHRINRYMSKPIRRVFITNILIE